ncbi:MAG TPA: type I methionyl aminopeptidase [Candidatus Paceibacterota bacterium]|jgi:methionyl aminopeptidase
MKGNIKTSADIEKMRAGGKRLARIVRLVGEAVQPGVSTVTLNELAERLIREGGDEPSLLGYTPTGAPRPYPAAICISVNDEVVHGIPNEDPKILREGDIVGLDCVLTHQGRMTDTAITVPVGSIDAKAQKLIAVTREALNVGIQAAHAGNHVGDIGHAIETFVKPHGYGIVYELCGHGVGYAVHEAPQVPNVGTPKTGVKLRSGMVLALEPMLNAGAPEVKLSSDGYTFSTVDGSLSAHFEHTILITDKAPEILTVE